jgi:hypothetical protein
MRYVALRLALATVVGVACYPSGIAPGVSSPSSATKTIRPTTSSESFYSQYVATGLDFSRFRARWDARDYHAIYGMADDRLRAAITEDRFSEMLSAARERLGTVGRTRESRHDTRLVPGSEDVDITQVMESMFERGAATETFVWRVTPANLTYLVSYEVR